MESNELLHMIIGELKGLKQDISGLKDDVSGLKQDVSGLKQDVSGLKQDVSGLKDDVSCLKEDMAEVKQRVTKIEVTQENVTNPNISLLFEGQTGMNEKFYKLDGMENTLNNVKSDVEVIKDVVCTHSKDIRALKAIN